jgi:carbon-monoxide dehydrogenase small subunit
MTREVTATINGATFKGGVPENELLLDFLRERVGLIGVRQSCEVEVCGVCTVLIDGEPVSSCCHLAVEIDGRNVETIEGVTETEFFQEISDAFVRHASVQCGYCTPGIVLTAKALAGTTDLSTEQAIREAMSGNLCRCTGYRSILDALAEVFQKYPQADR